VTDPDGIAPGYGADVAKASETVGPDGSSAVDAPGSPQDPALVESQRDVAPALARLDAVSGSDAADQVGAFAEAYEALQATLARIDDR
jgi:hypothetical protein